MTNPKSQTNPNDQNSKSQTRISRECAVLVIGNWDFEFVCYLMLVTCPKGTPSEEFISYLVLACQMVSREVWCLF